MGKLGEGGRENLTTDLSTVAQTVSQEKVHIFPQLTGGRGADRRSCVGICLLGHVSGGTEFFFFF